MDSIPIRAAVWKYADAHPESALAAWHDWFGGSRDSASSIDEFFNQESNALRDDEISELANNAPEIGIPMDASGGVDYTDLDKVADKLKDELGKAIAQAESDTDAEALDERDVPVAEGWETYYDEKPGWWDKEPWDLTPEEEEEQDKYVERRRAEDAAAAREAEELGLSPDEMGDGARAMWRINVSDRDMARLSSRVAFIYSQYRRFDSFPDVPIGIGVDDRWFYIIDLLDDGTFSIRDRLRIGKKRANIISHVTQRFRNSISAAARRVNSRIEELWRELGLDDSDIIKVGNDEAVGSVSGVADELHQKTRLVPKSEAVRGGDGDNRQKVSGSAERSVKWRRAVTPADADGDLGYHYGDLGKGRDMFRGNMDGRSTGHFGTGRRRRCGVVKSRMGLDGNRQESMA